jgi:hypothetical protein
MVLWTGLAIAAVAATVVSVGLSGAQAAGAFDKDVKTPLSGEDRRERARRAAAASSGGRSGTILTGGALSQDDQGGASSAGSSGTALLGG